MSSTGSGARVLVRRLAWNGRLSITVTLATAISLLVLVSVGGVLGVGIWLANKNTLALMSANANQGLAHTVDRIERHLLPAEDQARFIAERVESGEFDPEDRTTFGRLLTGGLAGVPQIESIAFFDPGLKTFFAARYGDGRLELGELDHSDDPRYREYLAAMPEGPHWVPPYWIERHAGTYFMVGIGALALSIVAAVLLGRRIARPIVRFSAAAGQVRELNIAEIGDLPGSVFRELDQQARAFNAMLSALRWFELYVPRKIVGRLVKRGDIDDTISSARKITVMFTDIAGFSSVAEHLSAPEVAALVNRHFEIVAGCIEVEEGTVDKFIGDSVMAFWGAPEAQADAAERACRAALAIADGIRAENARRREEGDAPLGIRIGIHTGSATVGNIGAPGRINYTIIGDAVNVGQRLEQLGKTLFPADSETAILVSGATASELGPDFHPAPAGRHPVKGRAGELDVFRLGT